MHTAHISFLPTKWFSKKLTGLPPRKRKKIGKWKLHPLTSAYRTFLPKMLPFFALVVLHPPPPSSRFDECVSKKEARKHPLIGRKWEKTKKRTCNFFSRHFISQIAGCIPKCVSRNKKECHKCKPHIPAPPLFSSHEKKEKKFTHMPFPHKERGRGEKETNWNGGKNIEFLGHEIREREVCLMGLRYFFSWVEWILVVLRWLMQSILLTTVLNFFLLFLPSPHKPNKKEHIIPPPPWASIQTPLRWC